MSSLLVVGNAENRYLYLQLFYVLYSLVLVFLVEAMSKAKLLKIYNLKFTVFDF